MTQKQLFPFHITSVDSLGQGVSKITDKVAFIPKTTIGDKGTAIVMSEKKGVIFGKKVETEVSSPQRIMPVCPHFEDCPSCHYQHVSYEDECSFKKESFQKLMRKLPLPDTEMISATQRLNYRNRVQLHYSIKNKLIGMKDPQTFKIIPIPNCLIAVPEVLNEMHRLYQNDNWIKEAPASCSDGHIEIYWLNNKLQVSWNKPYASGGFTQINEPMNQKLKAILNQEWNNLDQGNLLDLFGGNGNLSDQLSYSRRLCVDSYSDKANEEFLNQDLYDSAALKNVIRHLKKNDLRINYLILDPPRSGLKNLNEWALALLPAKIAYVSCDPHTLARDLQSLSGYSITKSFLIDFFPSTFHFESLIFLSRKPE